MVCASNGFKLVFGALDVQVKLASIMSNLEVHHHCDIRVPKNRIQESVVRDNDHRFDLTETLSS